MSDFVRLALEIIISVFDMVILMIFMKVVLGKNNCHTSTWFQTISFVLICGIQYTITQFQIWQLNFSIGLLGTFLLTFLYNAKVIRRAFSAISFFVFAALSELLTYGLVVSITQSDIFDDEKVFYCAILSKLILFIMVIIVSLIIHKSSLMIRFKDYICLIATPLISLATIIAMTVQLQNSSENSGITICFIVIGIMIINITVYYLMENIIEATEIREKQSRLEVQFAFQEQKYEQTSLSFKKISSIIHDTNKHLVYLRECFEQDEKEEALLYIDKATERVEKSYHRVNTGHLVIDALVSNAFNIAVSSNITFKTDIRIDREKINIERYDLSVTLGNLLDNAIEACKKISNSDDRYIHVSIVTTDTSIVIDITNSKTAESEKSKKQTKVSDKLLHGYGLGNVSAIAEKYGGAFSTTCNESSFEAIAVLPLRD
jgi:signal transduction histidine kinase